MSDDSILHGSGNTYRAFNRKLEELSVSQHRDPKLRKLIDRLEIEGYAWKPLNFSFELLYTLHASVKFIVSSLIIMQQLPLIVLFLVVGVLPAMFVQKRSGDAGWGIWGAVGDDSRTFWGISAVLRNKQSIEEIIPQRSAHYLLSKADTAIIDYTKRAVKIRGQYAWYGSIASVFEMLMAGASYLWLVDRAVARAIGFDSFVFLSSLIWQTLSSVRLVTTSVARALELVPFMRDFVYFTELKNDLPRVKNPIILDDEPLTIVFNDVSFRYPRQTHDSLQHISMTITPGSHIALVGENGAGKTTLIKLLLRFYDPTGGTITVNGHDLKTIDLDSYYQHIGTLFQEFNRYPLSFTDNITLTDNYDKKRYKEALDIAGANAVLRTLKSDQTMLGADFEDGVDLSGGQWQRVAIARNLYAAGDAYILDEPTSAIDSLTEQKIFEKLYRELVGKTLITISHRFNTVRHADTIIVLKEGQIIESGTHASLMQNKSLYQEMFTAQAEGYLDS